MSLSPPLIDRDSEVPPNSPMVNVWLEQGIIYCKFSPQTSVTLEVAQHMIKEKIRLADGKYYPLCADYRNVVNLSKEAREYFSSEEGEKNLTAGAMIVQSSVTKIITNFYLSITKPRLPAKLFTDFESALQWLKQYKNDVPS